VQICVTPLNVQTEYSLTGAGLCYMSYTSGVIAILLLKFVNFRYHGNRGRSEQIVTVTFKQVDP